jgi:hypothetical protein
MAQISISKTHVLSRRTIEILADTKRAAEGSIDALRYAKIVTDGSTVVSKRDRAQGLHIATITLDYALDNATIQRIRSW